jgi:hypothetical protein
MATEDRNTRWAQLAAATEDIYGTDSVVVPTCISRIDGKPHELSPKAMRFAEALSFTDAWSRISDARNRRLAA